MNRSNRLVKIAAWWLILVFVMSLCPFSAVYAESRPMAKDIAPRSQIIGTFLIDFSAVDAETVKLAEQSAEKYDQKKKYYKSEFDEGNWYDITQATNISGVLKDKGKIVTNAEIDALPLTHWAKSPGEIIDLDTGKKVSASSINFEDSELPASLQFLEDDLMNVLSEMKKYEAMSETEEDEKKQREYADMYGYMKFLVSDFTDDIYKSHANEVDLLELYKDYINSNIRENRENYIGELMKIREQLVLKMQIRAAQYVEDRASNLINELKERKKYLDLINTISEASSKAGAKRGELETKLAEMPDGVLDKEKFNLQNTLLSQIIKKDYTAANAAMEEILAVNNILGGTIINKALELSILKRAKTAVEKDMEKNAVFEWTDVYKEMSGNKEPEGVIKKARDEHKTMLDGYMEDILYIIEEITKRSDEDSTKLSELTEQKSALMKILSDVVSGDNGSLGYDQTQNQLGDAIKKIQDMINLLLAQQSEDISNAVNENLKKAENLSSLKEEFLKEIENGNIDKAVELQNQMDSLLSDMESSKDELYNQLGTLLMQKSDLEAQLEAALQEDSQIINEIQSKLNDVVVKLAEQLGLLSEKDQQTVDKDKAMELKNQLDSWLAEMKASKDELYDQLGTLLMQKSDLEAQLGTALQENTQKIAEIQNKLQDIGVKLAELSGLIPEKDQQLVGNFKQRIQDLLDELTDEKSDISMVKDAADKLAKAYTLVPEGLKQLAYDENAKGQLLDTLQLAINSANAMGNAGNGSALFMIQQNLDKMFENMSLTGEQRMDKNILEKLLDAGETNQTMDTLSQKYYAAVRARNEAQVEKDRLKTLLDATIKSDSAAQVSELAVKLDQRVNEVLIRNKEILFLEMDLSEAARREKVTLTQVQEKDLLDFESNLLKELTVLEKSKYTDETYKLIEEYIKKEQEMVSSSNEVLRPENIVTRGFNLRFNEMPYIYNGRLYVPLRQMIVEMGGSIVWVWTENKSVSRFGEMEIVCWNDRNELRVDGKLVSMEAPCMFINGRQFVPAETLGTLLGYKVRVVTVDKKSVVIFEKNL